MSGGDGYLRGLLRRRITTLYGEFRALDGGFRLYAEDEIPWQALAFPTIVYTLRRYFADFKAGRFGFYMGDIVRDGHKAIFLQARGNPGADRLEF